MKILREGVVRRVAFVLTTYSVVSLVVLAYFFRNAEGENYVGFYLFAIGMLALPGMIGSLYGRVWGYVAAVLSTAVAKFLMAILVDILIHD